jgi:hypothetical protein
MTQRDWRAFQFRAKEFFEREFGIVLRSEMSVHLEDGQTHRFDLGSEDGKVLVECKSYTFTRPTGNEPAAKLNHARTDAHLLRSSHAQRKIIIFDDDVHPKKGSLAELFARRNNAWRADVEVWRFWDGVFEKIRPR